MRRAIGVAVSAVMVELCVQGCSPVDPPPFDPCTDDDVVLLVHVDRMSGLACEHDPWTLTVTNAWHEGGDLQLTGWRECP